MPDEQRLQQIPTRDDPVALRVRERLAAARRSLGLEPELLDVVCGLRRGTIARLEAGRSRITALHLYRLAAVLDVTVDWFFDTATSAVPHPPAAATTTRPGYHEMEQFLKVFAHLGSGPVRTEIRDLVHAVANLACDRRDGSLPVTDKGILSTCKPSA